MPLVGAQCLWLTLLAMLPPAPDSAPRTRVELVTGWRYAPGPLAGAEAPAFDDAAWELVSLPHTWNAVDAFAKSPGYRRGEGWYRRALVIPASTRGHELFARFEGANQVADVFLNGTPVGHHEGGYTAFVCRLTAAARPGGPNLLAVRVSNAPDPHVPPLQADFTFYGGLYRGVSLLTTAPTHFEMLDHGGPGLEAVPTDVSAREATLAIRAALVNDGARPGTVTCRATLRDPDGRIVGTREASIALGANARHTWEPPALAIHAPHLWSHASPERYALVAEIRVAGRIVDTLSVPVGFRFLDCDAAAGMRWNGERVRLFGTNRHQDRAGVGNAVPESLQREDIRRIARDGFRFVRLAHYPQDPAVLDECDAQGLLVWMEIPVVNRITPDAAFAARAEDMLVEMIRQHRQHPSIALWGLANEVLLQPPAPAPPGYVDSVHALVQRLNLRAHEEDPTRLTAVALSIGELDNGSGIQDVPDVLGLNLYFGWYYRTLSELGPFLDDVHARHPSRPLIVSEYGADSDERIHAASPVAFDFSAEYQQRFHESQFPQLAARPWLVATAVWNQFDFGSKGRDDSKANLNKKGLYYFDRSAKDIAYYYRASLATEPVLHVASRDHPRWVLGRAGEERATLTVYSNLPEVECSLDGAPLGRRVPADGIARWPLPLAAGHHVLEARGVGAAAGTVDRCAIEVEDRRPITLDSGPATFTLALNAGAAYAYTDSAGCVWEADRAAGPGVSGGEGGVSHLDHHRMFGSDDDALFQASREGVERYRLAVPAGHYDVELLFAETLHEHPGERVFEVLANGKPVIAALDLTREAGRYGAVRRTFTVEVAERRGLDLEFRPRVGVPTVSGVRVTRGLR